MEEDPLSQFNHKDRIGKRISLEHDFSGFQFSEEGVDPSKKDVCIVKCATAARPHDLQAPASDEAVVTLKRTNGSIHGCPVK
jgi:hypothetical protein